MLGSFMNVDNLDGPLHRCKSSNVISLKIRSQQRGLVCACLCLLCGGKVLLLMMIMIMMRVGGTRHGDSGGQKHRVSDPAPR